MERTLLQWLTRRNPDLHLLPGGNLDEEALAAFQYRFLDSDEELLFSLWTWTKLDGLSDVVDLDSFLLS